MSRFGSKIIKAVFVLTLICGSVAYASTQANAENARSALQTVEIKTDLATQWVGEKKDVVRKKWQRFDVDSRVTDLQHKTRPMGQKIAAVVGPKVTPSMQVVEKGERRMSLPAILLILVFGGVFFFMGRSGPSSMLGGRH